MLVRKNYFVFALLLGLSAWMFVGCKPAGSSGGGDGHDDDHEHADGEEHEHSQGPQVATPDAAIVTFLNAVRDGRHEDASVMLTKKARIEMENAGMHVQPPGSPDAQFNIVEVRAMPEEKGAHVDSTWVDSQRTYDITWILRQQDNTWRVAGMATTLFEGQAPLILNFEDPNEMKANVQAAEDEIARRMQPTGEDVRQATLPPNGQDGPLR